MNTEQPTTYRESSRCWAILVCSCFLAGIGFALPMTCFSIFVPPLIGELGTSVTQIILYFTFIGIGSVISNLVFPRFVVRYAKPMIVVAGIVMALCYIALATVPTVPMIWAAGLLCGLCFPVCSVIPVPIMLNNWFAKNQGTYVGIALAMIGIFGVVFSPILTAIIQAAGWRTAMITMAVIIAVVMIVCGLFIVQISPIPLGILPKGATQEETAKIVEGAKTAKKGPNPNLPGLTLSDALKTPAFYIVAIALLCIGIIGCFNTQINTISQVSGFDTVAAGVAVSCASAGMFLGKILAGWIKDKAGVTIAVLVGMICGIVAFILVVAGIKSNGTMPLYVGAFLAGFCTCYGSVGAPFITADSCGPKDFASIMGVLAAIGGLGMVFGTPIYSRVFDTSGSYVGVLIGLVVLAVITFLLVLVGCKACQSKWKKSPQSE